MQGKLLEKNLLNLNNAIGKYIEEEKIFEDSETNKEPGIFEKFFGVFFGNKKVNKILSNIEKILSEYGIIDLETAQQVKELEVLQKEYDEYLPIEDDKLYLPQGQNKKEKIEENNEQENNKELDKVQENNEDNNEVQNEAQAV